MVLGAVFQYPVIWALMSFLEELTPEQRFNVAQGFVPLGQPFWMIDLETLPHQIPQEEWDLTPEFLGEPSGYGTRVPEEE